MTVGRALNIECAMNIDSAMNIDPELQAQVDAQLLEQGAFTALAWLIDCGRLAGDVYDGWRRRDIEFTATLRPQPRGEQDRAPQVDLARRRTSRPRIAMRPMNRNRRLPTAH